MLAIRERADGGGGVPSVVGTVVLELLQLFGTEVRGVCALRTIEGLQEGQGGTVERGAGRSLPVLPLAVCQPIAKFLPRPAPAQAAHPHLRLPLQDLQVDREVHVTGEQAGGDGGEALVGVGDDAAHL